ncbi:hypothetical protein F5Y17DRAFT_281288 [Xylariaceae sp. FL0594]|nr:hypothetical protein F5Y17DRAFT_281288 [Xylariaceae sp. FL0594]
MTTAGSTARDGLPSPLPGAVDEPSAKRRKLRKGTRSCWECKRRKYKCTWSRSSTDNSECDGCRSRGTACISQEFSDNNLPAERRAPDDCRLQRVEALLEALTRKVDSAHACAGGLEQIGNQEPVKSSLPPLESSASHGLTGLLPSLPGIVSGSSLGQFGEVRGKVTPLIHALITAWPGKEHRDAILDKSLANTGSLHPAMSAACSGFRTPPSPRDVLQLPPPGSGPLIIAQKLLLLSTYLQVASSHAEPCRGPEPAPNYRELMTRAFETVKSLVTHNDDLPTSIETVECLIIESQYYNYTGATKRAWMTLSRAVAMAQLIGLNRQPVYKIEAASDENPIQSHRRDVWFLLVHFSQYLSIMLGLSTCISLHDHQTEPEMLLASYHNNFTPSERMGRLHSLAAGRILRRNHTNRYDSVEMRKIDRILQMAMACMPPNWWLPPKMMLYEENETVHIDRLMVHFAHHNLLLQLHLPLLLQSLTSGKLNTYSTTAGINAGRELLTRFTAYRSRYPTVSYCRGLDYFSFVASVTLCLLHIHSSCHRDEEPYTNNNSNGVDDNSCGNSISDLVAHQRVAHRGLVEDALEKIRRIASYSNPYNTVSEDDNGNNIVWDMISILQRLLTIEDEAFRGGSGSKFTVTLSPSPSSSHLKIGSPDKSYSSSDDVLEVDLPFCGTVRIEHASVGMGVNRSGSMQLSSEDVRPPNVNPSLETPYGNIIEGHSHSHLQRPLDFELNSLFPAESMEPTLDMLNLIQNGEGGTGVLDDTTRAPLALDMEGIGNVFDEDGQALDESFFHSLPEVPQ